MLTSWLIALACCACAIAIGLNCSGGSCLNCESACWTCQTGTKAEQLQVEFFDIAEELSCGDCNLLNDVYILDFNPYEDCSFPSTIKYHASNPGYCAWTYDIGSDVCGQYRRINAYAFGGTVGVSSTWTLRVRIQNYNDACNDSGGSGEYFVTFHYTETRSTAFDCTAFSATYVDWFLEGGTPSAHKCGWVPPTSKPHCEVTSL